MVGWFKKGVIRSDFVEHVTHCKVCKKTQLKRADLLTGDLAMIVDLWYSDFCVTGQQLLVKAIEASR
jgi:hypothetical protein